MFENVLYQTAVTGRIASELSRGSLPRAVLFSGPMMEGKLTTALELARGLSCSTPLAPWNCRCHSCRLHRVLLHPDAVMVGSRPFRQEIRITADLLIRTGIDPARYSFIRAVRKLLRRFDPVLWSGDESRLEKAASAGNSAADELEALTPPAPIPGPEELEKICRTIVSAAETLCGILPADGIPVQVVRNLSSWAYLSPSARYKTVILENADQMNESAGNAMLKILEEPPEHTFFILTTSRPEAVIPTITSRLRRYEFRLRNADQSREVLKRIFRLEEATDDSVEEFFLRQGFPGSISLVELGQMFRDALNAPTEPEGRRILTEIRKVMESVGSGWLRAFLKELLGGIRREIVEGAVEADTVAQATKKTRILQDHVMYGEHLNISTATILENLYLRMR
jgi:DNA polymerase III delta prime subunit